MQQILEKASPIKEPGTEKRRCLGWYLAFFLLGIQVFCSLYMSFLPQHIQKDTAVDMLRKSDSDFKVALATRLRPYLGLLTGTKDSKASLNKIIEELTPYKEHPLAGALIARTLASATFERDRKVLPQKLLALTQDKHHKEDTYQIIYGNNHLTSEEIAKVRKHLVNGKCVTHKIALAHAYEKAGDLSSRDRILGEILEVKPYETGFFIFLASLIVGGISLWVLYFLKSKQGKWRLQGHPTPLPELVDADRYMTYFSLSQVTMLFTSLALGVALAVAISIVPKPGPLAKEAHNFASSFGGFLYFIPYIVLSILLLWCVLRFKIYGKSLGFKSILGNAKPLKNLVLWGIGGAIAMSPINLVLQGISSSLSSFFPEPDHPFISQLTQSPNLSLMLGILVCATIIAPFTEEIAFRGLLLPALAKRTNNIILSILISSFLFAAIHPTGIPSWPHLAAFGAMACMLTYQTRSLVPAMIMHGVSNLITCLTCLMLS